MKKLLSVLIISTILLASCGKDPKVDLAPVTDSAKISMSFFGNTSSNGFKDEETIDFSTFVKVSPNKNQVSRVNLKEGSSVVFSGLQGVQLTEVILSIKDSKTIKLDVGTITPNADGTYTVPVARAYTFLQQVLDEMLRTKKTQTLQIVAKSAANITNPVKVELLFNAEFVF